MRLFRRKSLPVPADSNIGNVLLRMGLITADQLGEALERQRQNPDKRLGEILVDWGVVMLDELESALGVQGKFRGPHSAAAELDIATQQARKAQQETKRALDELERLESTT